MDRSELISVLTAQQWEKCKGELMALVALFGAEKSTSRNDRWQLVEMEVDKFVMVMEAEILY